MTTNWLAESVARNPSPPPLVLPARFADATVEGIPSGGRLRAVVTKYAQDFWTVAPRGIGMLLIGKAGTYKTYASSALARLVHQAGVETLFVQCPITMGMLERNRYSSLAADTIRKLETVPFVVMDDFSQITPNSFGARVLLEVAEARFSNLRPTVWTGNVTIDGGKAIDVLSSLYGPSFGRRVVEASGGYGVYIKN